MKNNAEVFIPFVKFIAKLMWHTNQLMEKLG